MTPMNQTVGTPTTTSTDLGNVTQRKVANPLSNYRATLNRFKGEDATREANKVFVQEYILPGHVDDFYTINKNQYPEAKKLTKSERDDSIKANVLLAREYALEATKHPHTPKSNSILASDACAFYGEHNAEHHEVFCIAHLTIASRMGDAGSSLQLAKIYKKGEYLIPSSSTEQTIQNFEKSARDQAILSEDGDTLHALGDYLKSEYWGRGKEAAECHAIAVDFGYEMVDNEKGNCNIQ